MFGIVATRAQARVIMLPKSKESTRASITQAAEGVAALPASEQVGNEAFLPPIEKPPGLMMKLVYAMTRRQFGKVLAPISVFAARMPLSFGQFYGKISSLDKKLRLPRETVMLIREQVARTNVCLFCIDIGRYFSIKSSMNQAKFDALGQYQTNALFSEGERAALDFATELTRNKTSQREIFDRLAKCYSEREICEITWIVASEHFYNLTNIGLNIHSDMVCDVARNPSSKL
jgi:alkylhydroperoxidase family enzyme